MAAINGTVFTLKIGGVVVQCETDSSLNFTKDMIETTCKSSGTDKTFIPGEGSGTIDVSAVYDETGAVFDYSQAFADYQAGTSLTFVYGSVVALEKNYSGSVLISDLTNESPQNDRVTWGMTLQITGLVTENTNP